MLRITESKNAEAAKQYFGKSMIRSDYYIDGQEIAGQWGGKGAERFGLTGTVDQERYFALCDNQDPNTGEQLTPRQKDNRRAGYDFTVEFRERVSACSDPPAGIDAGDKIHVALRVSLNRDGTLASPPRLLEPIASPKEQAVMQSAINALQKCQPYTMLPPDRYKDWKSIDLTFFPMNFSGG